MRVVVRFKVLVFNSILNLKLLKATFNCSFHFPSFDFGCPVPIVLGFLSMLVKIAIQFARFESNFSGFCFALLRFPLCFVFLYV